MSAPFIRHILDEYRHGRLCAAAAAQELGLGRSGFYKLYSQYLRACAQGHAHDWSPGVSGGDHQPTWPPAVSVLLKKLLTTKPPLPYSACASELHRRLIFKTDRASVRRWAIENHLAPDTRYKTPPKPVKRWQMRDLGALWQYDTSPHAWLPDQADKQALLNLLDDATRYNVGARLYQAENLLAHLDFLPRAFQAHGLPLALYVDYHSFFFTHTPDAFTQLGAALHFYDITLRYAPTPQAKAKSNAATITGKNVSRPCWPLTAFWNSKGPTSSWSNSSPMSISMKSTANWAPPHRPPGNRPLPTNTPFCDQSRLVPGGPLSGASKTPSGSVTMAKFQWVLNACPSTPLRAPRSFAACVQMATSITSAMHPSPKPNQSSCSIVPSSNHLTHVHFCSHTKFHF